MSKSLILFTKLLFSNKIQIRFSQRTKKREQVQLDPYLTGETELPLSFNFKTLLKLKKMLLTIEKYSTKSFVQDLHFHANIVTDPDLESFSRVVSSLMNN